MLGEGEGVRGQRAREPAVSGSWKKRRVKDEPSALPAAPPQAGLPVTWALQSGGAQPSSQWQCWSLSQTWEAQVEQ